MQCNNIMFEAKYIFHVLAMVKTKEENTTKMVEHSERERERGHWAVYYTSPQSFVYVFLFISSQPWELLIG